VHAGREVEAKESTTQTKQWSSEKEMLGRFDWDEF